VTSLSWGFEDLVTGNGYIAVDSNTQTIGNRGCNIVQLNSVSCSISSVLSFDTHADATKSTDLANYITGLPTSTVLIGATIDEASWSLNTMAIDALLGIGVNVTGLEYRGKLAFVAQIGRPEATVMKLYPRYGHNLELAVSVRGNVPSLNKCLNWHVLINIFNNIIIVFITNILTQFIEGKQLLDTKYNGTSYRTSPYIMITINFKESPNKLNVFVSLSL